MIEVYLAQTDPCPPEFPDVLECFADRDVADRFAAAANVGLTDDPDDREERVVVVPMKVNTTTTVPAVQVSWHGTFVLAADPGHPAGYVPTGDLTHPFFRPSTLEPLRNLKYAAQVTGDALPAAQTTVRRWSNDGWVVTVDGSDRDAVTAQMREVAERLHARTFALTGAGTKA